MITDTKEIAERLRTEADYWRNYRKDNLISDVPNYLFSDSVLMAFGVNGIEEMDMPVYELFDKLAYPSIHKNVKVVRKYFQFIEISVH